MRVRPRARSAAGQARGVAVAAVLLGLVAAVLWFEGQHSPKGVEHAGISPTSSGSLPRPEARIESQTHAQRAGATDSTPSLPGEYLGELRVGTTNDYARYLGQGLVSIASGDDESTFVDVAVEEGRFAYREASGSDPHVIGGRLNGLDLYLESPVQLHEGRSEPVYFTWGDREVQVSVIDAETGDHLRWIEVFREREVRFAGPDPILADRTWLLPSEQDELVLRGAASPFMLPLPAGASDWCWIHSPGFVPFLFRYPSGLPRDKLIVAMHPAGSVTIETLGDTSMLNRARVRLYRSDGEDSLHQGQLAAERAALPRQWVDGLAPGRWTATLELPRSSSSLDVSLDRSDFTLESGQEFGLTLAAKPLTNSVGKGRIYIDLPDRSASATAPHAAVLVPQEPRSRRDSPLREIRWTEETRWGPIELPAGEWMLVLTPDNLSVRFQLAAGEELRLSVPGYRMTDCLLSIRDSRTNNPVAPQFVYWSCVMDWMGGSDEWPRGNFVALDVNARLVRLRAPRSKVRFLITADGYGQQVRILDLADEPDPVVFLEPLACLEIEFEAMDEVPTLSWLSGLSLEMDGVRIEPDSTQVVIEGGTPRGLAYLAGAGQLSIRFPPLLSHGSLVPMELEIAPGEHRRIVLGLDALLAID